MIRKKNQITDYKIETKNNEITIHYGLSEYDGTMYKIIKEIVLDQDFDIDEIISDVRFEMNNNNYSIKRELQAELKKILKGLLV